MALESHTGDTNDEIANRPSPGTSTQRATDSRVIRIDSLVGKRQISNGQPLNLSLQPGLPLVVHGRSGSGKTSLLSTLAGELSPLQGHVWDGTTDLLELPDSERYRHVSYMSQNDQLLDVSIGEFLSLGLPNVDEITMRQALHAVDLLDVLDQTDEGLDYRLGVGGSRISGGQARRLQLAAIYLHSPALLLLDEPFRGLQPTLVHTILHRLEPWITGRCCVIVTHDPAALPEQWPRLTWPQP
jgi:ATP-binding cassette subfamily C protein CydC